MKKYLCLLMGLFLLGQSEAQIRLPHILSSGVVLQQKADVNLWGWASPAEKISIKALECPYCHRQRMPIEKKSVLATSEFAMMIISVLILIQAVKNLAQGTQRLQRTKTGEIGEARASRWRSRCQRRRPAVCCHKQRQLARNIIF